MLHAPSGHDQGDAHTPIKSVITSFWRSSDAASICMEDGSKTERCRSGTSKNCPEQIVQYITTRRLTHLLLPQVISAACAAFCSLAQKCNESADKLLTTATYYHEALTRFLENGTFQDGQPVMSAQAATVHTMRYALEACEGHQRPGVIKNAEDRHDSCCIPANCCRYLSQ